MKTDILIEALEARIAPATLVNPTTVTYTDNDGDLVTVKTSKGTFDLSQFHFLADGGGFKLASLDLGGDQTFRGANLSIVATKILGDGFVPVVEIAADGIDLGNVTVDGDLVRIHAGDANHATRGLGTLHVQSLGASNLELPSGPISPTQSVIEGALNSLIVDLGVDGGNMQVNGNLGKVKIGEDLRGNGTGGGIVASGQIGSVIIGGSVQGGGGSWLPPGGADPVYFLGGRIVSTDAGIGSVKIGGSIDGSYLANTGVIQTEGSVGSIEIGFNLIGQNNTSRSGLIEVGGNLGRLKMGGSIVGGSVLSESAEQSGAVYVGGRLGDLRIGGDLVGGDEQGAASLKHSGSITADRLGRAVILGSVLAGDRLGTGDVSSNGVIEVRKTIGSVRIDGSLQGGDGTHAGIYMGAFAGDGNGTTNVVLNSLKIGGDVTRAEILAGYMPGSLIFANSEVQIGTVTVGGNWSVSDLAAGATSGPDGYYSTEDDFLIGDTNYLTGVVSKIAKITIAGQASGTLFNLTDGFGFVAERIGSMSVGGTKIALTTDLDDLALPGASDVRVREVGWLS